MGPDDIYKMAAKEKYCTNWQCFSFLEKGERSQFWPSPNNSLVKKMWYKIKIEKCGGQWIGFAKLHQGSKFKNALILMQNTEKCPLVIRVQKEIGWNISDRQAWTFGYLAANWAKLPGQNKNMYFAVNKLDAQ